MSTKKISVDQIKNLDKDKVDLAYKLLNEIKYQQAFISPITRFERGRHKKQEEVLLKFLEAEKDFLILLCGNRFGKTYLMTWLIAAIATGYIKHSRHKIDRTKPLSVLFVGNNYDLIKDPVHKNLTSFLRPDQFKTIRDGNAIKGCTIYGPNNEETHVVYKVTSGDTDTIFEGISPNFILVDEGISLNIFQSLCSRMAGGNCQFMQAYTRLPYQDDAGYLTDLLDDSAESEIKQLKPYMQIIVEGGIDDNPHLEDKEKEVFKASFGSEDSVLYQARVKGVVTRPRGAVLSYSPTIINPQTNEIELYNKFKLHEYLEIRKKNSGFHFLLHDYGFKDPSVWLLGFVDYTTGSVYFIDEVYKSRMSVETSSKLCFDMLHRWKVYDDVKMCIYDRYVSNESGQRDSSSETNILSLYMSSRCMLEDKEGNPLGELPAFPEDMSWDGRDAFKKNILTGLQWLELMLSTENNYTPGKPYYRFSDLCKKTIKEIKNLRWSDKPYKTGAKETTIGDNHSIDCLRYLTMARVNTTMWHNRFNDEEDKYAPLVGKSRGSYFLF